MKKQTFMKKVIDLHCFITKGIITFKEIDESQSNSAFKGGQMK